MNDNEFYSLLWDTKNKLDIACNTIDGAIRWSTGESWEHYMIKCKIVRLLKEKVMPYLIEDALKDMKNYKKLIDKDNKTPTVYTEAIFPKDLRADILAITDEGVFVIEIAKSEEKESLERKEKLFKELDIEMIEIRVK